MKNYYFIGIKGAGMSSLACVLFDFGNNVIGYDDNKNHAYTEIGLETRGIKVVYETPDLNENTIVIKTSAVREEHKEVMNAKEKGLKIYEYFEFLGLLTDDYKTIGIAGCHGKTSTTSLLSHVLESYEGVSYIIGDGTGKGDKNSHLFVIEACEYKRHFLSYHPTYSVITNIELDHVEYYKDIDDVTSAYQSFADITKDYMIVYGDNNRERSLKYNKVLFYGFNDNNDIIASNIKVDSKGTHFDVNVKGKFFSTFTLPQYGNHMILNALAAITVCYLENVPTKVIQDGLSSFTGAKRRFEEDVLGDLVIVDDYAHHPTEIKATIDAARQKYPDKQVIAVFKPNTYSRTESLYKDFIKALDDADYAYVTDIYCDREKPEEFPGITSKLIIDGLSKGEHISDNSLDKLLKYKGAVFLFMSCKDIYTMKNKFIEMLKRK